MTKQAQTQAILERPVCMASKSGNVCVLLIGHKSKHISGNGKVW